MKNMVYYLLVALVIYKAYQHFTQPPPAVANSLPTTIMQAPAPDEHVTMPVQPAVHSFVCDGRTHCSQMRTLAEAKFFLQHCPNTKMDGDHDGEPCESQHFKDRKQ